MGVMTFATLVSLLSDFVSQRRNNDSKSYEEFIEWVSAARHEELSALLKTNLTAAISIKALLGETQPQILEKLNGLDKSFASLASSLESFRGLSQFAYPELRLSAQAVSLITQFVESGARGIAEHWAYDGTTLIIINGPVNGTLDVMDQRFLRDDLDSLEDAGLISSGQDSRGARVYTLRRAAVEFVRNRSGA